MNAVETERNDKMETPSERTPSTVSADSDDAATTPQSPISSDGSEFEQHSLTANNNENQIGALALPGPLSLHEQRNVEEQFPLLKTSFHQDVDGEYEELWLRSPGVRCSERTLVYMVPGNPGAVYAHLKFMAIVCSSNDFDGCVMSHLGHCSCSTKVFGIKDHIAHHSRMIKEHSKKYPKILVLGHSLGSYILLKINDTLVELGDRLLGVGLLAPALTRFPTYPYWFYQSLFLTPKLSHRSIIKMNTPPDIWEIIQHGEFVPNMRMLLSDTLEVLPDELETERLEYWRSKKGKLFIIFSGKDSYMIPDVQHAVRCCIESPNTPEPSVVSISSILHCFVLSVEESKHVSYWMEQWIANKRFDCSTADGFMPGCPTPNKVCVNYWSPSFWGFLLVLILSFTPLILTPIFRKLFFSGKEEWKVSN